MNAEAEATRMAERWLCCESQEERRKLIQHDRMLHPDVARAAKEIVMLTTDSEEGEA